MGLIATRKNEMLDSFADNFTHAVPDRLTLTALED